MSAPHRIRLREPWEVKALGDGKTLHVRPFGKPRQLDPNERVWLVVEGATGTGEVRLNAEPLGSLSATACEFDVTDRLAPRNVLEVELRDRGERGEVCLEFRSPR